MPRVRLAASALAVLGAFAAAALLLPHSPGELRSLVLAAGAAAPVVGVLAWALLTPALFPGTVLAAAGGLAFGAVGGAGLALAGALAGGLVSFALARTVARAHVERLVARRPRLAALGPHLERRGFAAVLAARLAPGVPATALYYAAGASPVRVRSFAAAIAVGALLRTTPYAVLGEGMASGSIAGIAIAGASIAVGALAAAVLVRRLRIPAPAA